MIRVVLPLVLVTFLAGGPPKERDLSRELLARVEPRAGVVDGSLAVVPLVLRSGLEPGAAIIDVGGGASLLVDRLLARGYEKLAVLDISAKALAYAKHRLGERAAGIEWHEADVTAFNPAHTYALWHDRAVFHFLTESSDRRRYVTTLERSLQAGGHLIMAAFAIGGPERCSGLDIVQYDAGKIGAELGPAFELMEECSELHETPGGKTQQFSYFRFIYRR